MADISKITMPSGNVYDIKDAVARQMATGIMKIIGETTTALTDGSTTNPITLITDPTTTPPTTTSYTATEGNTVIYNSKEYVWVTAVGTAHWVEFGDLTGLGALAYKDTVTLNKTTVDIKPNATGTAANKYTPSGTNASSSVTGSCTVTAKGSISTGTGTANYTPAGSISVSSAGSTAQVKNATSVTVAKTVATAAPGATAPSNAVTWCSYDGTTETLSLYQIGYTTGESIGGSTVTVKTGDASYSFSGTGAELKFTGSSATGTISGTAAAQTFTGDDTYLKTASTVGTSITVS